MRGLPKMRLLTKRSITLGFALLLSAGSALASPESTAAKGASPAQSSGERYLNLELFNKVLQFVETNYVDEVKHKDLIQGAIKGMLETLDPHSAFLPPKTFSDMKTDTSGKFEGLGIELGMKDSTLTVVAPIEDTPAWKAGLQPGDKILKIGGESTKGMNLVEAVTKMRGKSKSPVKLSIYRDGFEKPKDVTLIRDMIKVQSVKSEALEPGFGYVRLTSFNENAADDVKKAIDKLERTGKLKGLVFDLRTNPGGLLDQAVEVSSLFIDDGVVVSTIGRNRDQKEVKYARKGRARKDIQVAILVNSSTASAAEIVAGALQDHHRAIVMGTPTFGKGSVQTVVPLGQEDGQEMGLKLTIARYFTPSGRSIQEKGVTPDISLEDYDTRLLAEARVRREALRERDLKGHIVNPDAQSDSDEGEGNSEQVTKKKKVEDDLSPIRFNPKEDFQVREAINTLKSYDLFKKFSASAK